MAERPRPVGAVAGRAIGDAGFAEMTVGHAEAALDLVGRERAEGIEETAPDRARRTIRAEELVGNARKTLIIANPLRKPPLAGCAPALRHSRRLTRLKRCGRGLRARAWPR